MKKMFVKELSPRDQIISMRVSTREREDLTLICTRVGKTTTELMREALGVVLAGFHGDPGGRPVAAEEEVPEENSWDIRNQAGGDQGRLQLG